MRGEKDGSWRPGKRQLRTFDAMLYTVACDGMQHSSISVKYVKATATRRHFESMLFTILLARRTKISTILTLRSCAT
jgi:hypothetical protein